MVVELRNPNNPDDPPIDIARFDGYIGPTLGNQDEERANVNFGLQFTGFSRNNEMESEDQITEGSQPNQLDGETTETTALGIHDWILANKTFEPQSLSDTEEENFPIEMLNAAKAEIANMLSGWYIPEVPEELAGEEREAAEAARNQAIAQSEASAGFIASLDLDAVEFARLGRAEERQRIADAVRMAAEQEAERIRLLEQEAADLLAAETAQREIDRLADLQREEDQIRQRNELIDLLVQNVIAGEPTPTRITEQERSNRVKLIARAFMTGNSEDSFTVSGQTEFQKVPGVATSRITRIKNMARSAMISIGEGVRITVNPRTDLVINAKKVKLKPHGSEIGIVDLKSEAVNLTNVKMVLAFFADVPRHKIELLLKGAYDPKSIRARQSVAVQPDAPHEPPRTTPPTPATSRRPISEAPTIQQELQRDVNIVITNHMPVNDRVGVPAQLERHPAHTRELQLLRRLGNGKLTRREIETEYFPAMRATIVAHAQLAMEYARVTGDRILAQARNLGTTPGEMVTFDASGIDFRYAPLVRAHIASHAPNRVNVELVDTIGFLTITQETMIRWALRKQGQTQDEIMPVDLLLKMLAEDPFLSSEYPHGTVGDKMELRKMAEALSTEQIWKIIESGIGRGEGKAMPKMAETARAMFSSEATIASDATVETPRIRSELKRPVAVELRSVAFGVDDPRSEVSTRYQKTNEYATLRRFSNSLLSGLYSREAIRDRLLPAIRDAIIANATLADEFARKIGDEILDEVERTGAEPGNPATLTRDNLEHRYAPIITDYVEVNKPVGATINAVEINAFLSLMEKAVIAYLRTPQEVRTRQDRGITDEVLLRVLIESLSSQYIRQTPGMSFEQADQNEIGLFTVSEMWEIVSSGYKAGPGALKKMMKTLEGITQRNK